MKAVFQRVARASVEAAGEEIASIGPGALLLLGVAAGDTEAEAALLAKKAAWLRVFSDQEDKMNLSVRDTGGEVLVVSNFTLCADCSHGRRPEFLSAARPEDAEPLYLYFAERLRLEGVSRVCTGCFGADMRVRLTGDGPVTLILDTEDWKKA